MPSFVNDVNGNKPQYYLPITITNNTTLASASGFTAHLTVDSSTYSTYEATDLSNINFQDGAGNILTSWLESGFTNTSTSTVYHILMNQTISASSNIDIYMVFYNTSAISKDNVVTGANPLYTSTYAQYDNGTNVFKQYTRFGGLSALPTGFTQWQTGGSGIGITFNSTNIQISGDGSNGINGGIQYTDQTLTSPFSQVMEYSVVLPDETGTSSVTYGFGIGTTGTASSFAGGGGGICLTCESTAGATVGYLNSGTAYELTLVNDGSSVGSGTLTSTGVLSLYFNNTATYVTLFNYSNDIPYVATTAISGKSLPYYVYATASLNPLTLYWVRTRQLINTKDNYSISYGSVTKVAIIFTYSEYQNVVILNTPNPFNYVKEYTSQNETETLLLTIYNKYSETENYKITFKAGSVLKYAETESYRVTFNFNLPKYTYSETESYKFSTVFGYSFSYSETESYIITISPKYLIKYSETENYKITFKESSLIKYSETESYTFTALFEYLFKYSETESYKLSKLLGYSFSYSEKESYTTKTVLILNYKYQEQQYEVISGVLPTVETSDYQGNFKPTYLLILPFNYQQYPANKSTTATVTFTPNYSNVPESIVTDQIVVSFTFTFTSTSTYTSPTVTTTITDSASTPVPNALVSWTATGGTTVSPISATTNSSGQASTTVSTAGGTVTATTTLLGVTETSSVAT